MKDKKDSILGKKGAFDCCCGVEQVTFSFEGIL
jgi:hypothetical protein